ncbi:response regulator [Larkinella harenae]
MSKTFNVLIVDDDEDDQFLIQLAFQQTSEKFRLQFASDGTQVLERIRKPTFLPDLILLDLNMPTISGFDVLKQIKNSPRYRHIPVIILSTSDSEIDINRCYELGANTFMVKPSSQNELRDLANLVRQYWFSMARIPTRRTNSN